MHVCMGSDQLVHSYNGSHTVKASINLAIDICIRILSDKPLDRS